MRDKRRERRVTVNKEFGTVRELMREYAMNVSESGVFIRTGEVLPVGTEVHLRFSVLLEDVETIEGAGRVVRAVEPADSDTPGIGVVFVSLTEASKEVLARLFTRR